MTLSVSDLACCGETPQQELSAEGKRSEGLPLCYVLRTALVALWNCWACYAGVTSDSWCSAGAALMGGPIINLGGGGDNNLKEQAGGNSIRRYQACNDNTCEIHEVRMPALLHSSAQKYHIGPVLPISSHAG